MKSFASHVRSVLQSASEVGSIEKLRRGSCLFEQGQESSSLFLLESGLVKLIRTSKNGNSILLSVLGQHQLLGVECMAQGVSGCAATAVCISDISCYRIPFTTAKRIFATPEYAHSLVTYLILQDQERIVRIEMQSLYEVEHRILHALAELAQMVKPSPDGLCFAIPMTQLELAGLVGATRETTSTTLSNLQARKLVKLGRRLMTTVHPKLLIDAADSKLTQGKSTC